MKRRTSQILIWGLFLIVVELIAKSAWSFAERMGLSYRPDLDSVACELLPVLGEIGQYRTIHGRFPSTLMDLAKTRDRVYSGWGTHDVYYAGDGSTFHLSRYVAGFNDSLDLVRESNETKPHWFLNDESDDRPELHLNVISPPGLSD